MGVSSSKNSSRRFGNGTRDFLSASMSAAVPTLQNNTSIPPGQTERAAFMNHPIYLPPPPPSSQKRQHVVGSNPHLVSWRASYDIVPGDLQSPIESPYNYNFVDNIHHHHSSSNNHRQRRRRQEQQQGAEHEEQVALPLSSRLKGAPKAAAITRRRKAMPGGGGMPRGGGGAVDSTGVTKQGSKRSRMLVPPRAPPPPRSPSSSPSLSESLGSRLDFCCCAECCAARGNGDGVTPEHCFCSSAISSTGEGIGRADDDIYRADHRATAFATTLTAIHDFQQHFPQPKTGLKQQQQLQELEKQFQQHRLQYTSGSDGRSGNIGLNDQEEYHIPTSRRGRGFAGKRIRRKREVEEYDQVGREERGEEENQESNNNSARQEHPENLNASTNDEATTCSAESSSELHLNRQHLQPEVSTRGGYQNSSNNNKNHSHKVLQTKTSKQAITTSTNMATTAASHLHNSSKQSNGTTSTIANSKKPSLERGLAMDDESRKRNGLLGLLPAAVQDQALQSKAVMNYLENCKDELSKYVYLRHLKDFNEKLFYYTLINNVQRLMPLVYTPTVGLACQKFSEIYMRPRGLFITANDAGRVRQIIGNWPERDVRVIVVTDGERILGLGDLGANGMGISIGKLSLYTALAGIPPQNVLPVTIDVGTENEFNLKDPFYIGLRQHRLRGEKYDALIEEFMQAVVERWGRSCLIQFEDFANSTAFNLLNRYRKQYCTFNDDIQGTASVSLSGLISAAKLTGKRLSDCSFLFYGAGEANLGTAQLLIMAMAEDGLKAEEAKQHIWLVDSKGLVVSSRQDLNEHKRKFARDASPLRDLEAIIDFTKPTAIVGASAQGGSFTESICKKMATYNERPIIFALSNPTSKAECTADQAYRWTDGKCVFASGSPFDPVEYNGKTYVTGQGNNAYIFPGVGLAAIGAHTHTIPEEAFLVAARALSDQVASSDTEVGLIYPRLTKIREVTLKVAARVLEHLFAERLATYRPEPNDKMEFLRGIQYDPSY